MARIDAMNFFTGSTLFFGSISENVILGTNAGNEGGGAYVLGYASIDFTDFGRNRVISGTGGALYLAQGGVITSNYLSGNSARAGGGVMGRPSSPSGRTATRPRRSRAFSRRPAPWSSAPSSTVRQR